MELTELPEDTEELNELLEEDASQERRQQARRRDWTNWYVGVPVCIGIVILLFFVGKQLSQS
ncbi:hypothetical protein HN604_01235 [archaeon]|jgi:hypothetical protein|nr:hypothetical protein [archaeon]MBT6606759.1 hypothetical protein [archaeon]MBT7251768.1 hypothetical protein [archaeon]MBT7660687.1 hypothetical protein [archaeon]